MKKFFKWVLKILGVILALFIIVCALFYFSYSRSQTIAWGVSFSPSQARYLGFDAKTMYDDILNQLHPQKIRLMAFWELIEPSRGKMDFSELDYFVNQAGTHNVDVTLAVGLKEPRWPECHTPGWYNSLTPEQKQDELMKFIQAVVTHYKNSPAIKIWQVENEPLFPFGPGCPVTEKATLMSEVNLVKSLDSRPILVTDSGELGSWWGASSVGADYFGSTMYREVYDKRVGNFKYPWPPAFYQIKAGMLKFFGHTSKVLGVELQAEPWFQSDVYHTPVSAQTALMNPTIFADNVEFARQVGFAQNYLWGVEWWYWMKQTKADSSMWDAAKKVFQTQ